MCKHKSLELSFISVSGVSVPCGFVCVACHCELDLYELTEMHQASVEKDEKRAKSARKVAFYAYSAREESKIFLDWARDADTELVLAHKEIERLKVENDKLRS